MRIGFVIMSLELGGGAEHDIVNLSAGLKDSGHEPFVITSGGRLSADLESNGIPVILCPVATRTPWKLMANGERLAAIAELHKIEVLNPQGVFPGLSCYWASRRLKRRGLAVPSVVTIHMLDRVTWWYYKLAALILNRVADHVVVESNCERLRLQRRGMSRPTTVLHNCFPSAQLTSVEESREEIRREMGWPEDHVVFVVPARMEPQKGHEVLFQALVGPQVRGLPLLFYLAGDGPLLDRHKKAVEDLGLQSRVVFGGFRRDLPKLYKAADVFLLSSHWESLPLSIREGMVAGLPVISSKVAGIPEAVEDGRSGLLVPRGNPNALAAAIAKLASDPALRLSMGQRGKEIGSERFDYERWIASTVATMAAVRAKLQGVLQQGVEESRRGNRAGSGD